MESAGPWLLPIGLPLPSSSRHYRLYDMAYYLEREYATEMDDSVLNNKTNQPFRQFLLDHFVIRAVIGCWPTFLLASPPCGSCAERLSSGV